ncbi:MAG TPA: mechanosensitive ion channel domain-containing protein [Acidobacteriaceae bacterium]|nr:mechanosensitive ion channel domain-containing protein [Acidobacteriaceae bacterium]
MASSPIAGGGTSRSRIFSGAKLIGFVVLLALLALFIVLSWLTRGAVADLAVLRAHGTAAGNSLVDLRPWQTAQTLASFAVTSEENEYAREAEHLADHEVDQAFAAALRKAALQTETRVLTGPALALSQRITLLTQEIAQDRSVVAALKAKSAQPGGSGAGAASTPLQVAEAQLALDSDELSDAQHDLDRTTNNQSVRIQEELAAHEASMRKYDSEQQGDGQVAVVSAKANHTLAARLKAWSDQRGRYDSVEQALANTQSDVRSLTAEHNALEGQADAGAAAQNGPATLSDLQKRSVERQILSIDDDRIQTDQQLATVYQKWGDQILLQHRIVTHLILGSLEVIVGIVLGMILGDALVRRLMMHPSLDHRQTETLRTIFEVSVQVLGVLLIILVLFGPPRETTTMIGLATAALTISLQDYILAFVGWFMLVGKNGLRVGDIVEINGVCGEVAEVGLMTTTLLETTGLADKGEPTGRRISFLNSFAIRGQYFNFSSRGQWLWDEITVTVPVTEDVYSIAREIEAAARHESEEAARMAEQEWKHSRRTTGLVRQSAAPAITLRPSGGSIDIQVRYVTSARRRSEVRDRLYRQVIGLFQKQSSQALHEAVCEPAGTQV